jgi:hypothetical protein
LVSAKSLSDTASAVRLPKNAVGEILLNDRRAGCKLAVDAAEQRLAHDQIQPNVEYDQGDCEKPDV